MKTKNKTRIIPFTFYITFVFLLFFIPTEINAQMAQGTWTIESGVITEFDPDYILDTNHLPSGSWLILGYKSGYTRIEEGDTMQDFIQKRSSGSPGYTNDITDNPNLVGAWGLGSYNSGGVDLTQEGYYYVAVSDTNTGTNDDIVTYWELYYDGAEVTAINPITNTTTRIVEIIPANNTVIATSSQDTEGVWGATTTVSVEWYINEEDIGFIQSVYVFVEQVDQNTLYGLSNFSPYTVDELIQPIAGPGLWDLEIWLPVGNYRIGGKIGNDYLGGVFANPFETISNNIVESIDESNPRAQYRQYVVGESSTIGALRQNANRQLENILEATGGPEPSVDDCNVLSGFDFGQCMAFAFIPSSEQIQNFGNILSTNIYGKFPMGYGWSMVQMMKSTTTIAIPAIDFTVPPVIPGTGTEFRMALEPGILDYVLNATTGPFTNEDVDGDATLYEVTSYYWNIFVYLAVFLYILGRIMGSHVIGQLGDFFGDDIKETYSDVSYPFKRKKVDFGGKDATGKIRQTINGKTYRDMTSRDIRKALEKGNRPVHGARTTGRKKKTSSMYKD